MHLQTQPFGAHLDTFCTNPVYWESNGEHSPLTWVWCVHARVICTVRLCHVDGCRTLMPGLKKKKNFFDNKWVVWSAAQNFKQPSPRTPAKNNVSAYGGPWRGNIKTLCDLLKCCKGLCPPALALLSNHQDGAGCSEPDGFMCHWPPAQQINGPLFFYASEMSTEAWQKWNNILRLLKASLK